MSKNPISIQKQRVVSMARRYTESAASAPQDLNQIIEDEYDLNQMQTGRNLLTTHSDNNMGPKQLQQNMQS